MRQPVPGVQIVGIAQRDASRKKLRGGGLGGPPFFPTLLLRAALHYPNACNRLAIRL